jgi:hypothetical protein
VYHSRLRQAALLLGLAVLGCTGTDGGAENVALNPFALSAGDCFDDPGFGPEDVFAIPGVPCSEPHDNEVYAVFDLPGESWPDDADVERMAYQGCLDRFEEAIGATYEASILAYTTLFPSEDSWETLGDREVVCIAYHMDTEKLQGSVLGWGK